MAIVEIYYTAKCKHCKKAKKTMKGKRLITMCGQTNTQIALRDKACSKFEL